MAKRQIPVEELRHGMYVVELDRSWLGTPFLFQGFPLSDDAQIEALKNLFQHVFIDPERDQRAVSVCREAAVPQPGPVIYNETASLEQELVVAKEVYATFVKTVDNCLQLLKANGEINVGPLAEAVTSMSEASSATRTR